MHNLDKLILEWRKEAATTDLREETLDELETHLREATEHFVRSGIPASTAFERALTELGALPGISSEFRKLDQPIWLPIKLAIGATALTAAGALLAAMAIIGRHGSGGASLLLAAHVFMIIVGYSTTLLIGGMGVCFLSQRCFAEFSTSRLRSISRVSFVLGGVALLLTTVGVVLGMVWAKTTWGRYWTWDAKETGGLCVIIWLVFYVLAHRFFKGSARGILTASTIGNIVVSLAWFGPQLNVLYQHHLFGQSMLLVSIAANLVFFATGCCPACWLKPKQADF